jgi:hypothetical protein
VSGVVAGVLCDEQVVVRLRKEERKKGRTEKRKKERYNLVVITLLSS